MQVPVDANGVAEIPNVPGGVGSVVITPTPSTPGGDVTVSDLTMEACVTGSGS